MKPSLGIDPVNEAHLQGQRAMRDRIAVMLAGWAASHPSKIIQDELHQFADDVRQVSPL